MPPMRTTPPAKAIKTERTHEENQERAYIAASRRSDRSLEARVESARRASEIHKRRTGRSLRVTEQDVINEEMYEEEDDDLPMHYRRLTAHLQTGSADFNRRLAAYLTQQVAVRSMMGQMAQNPYAQFPSTPYQQAAPNMYQSPMMPQQSNPMTHSPTTSFRSAPYPSPHQPGFRQSHQRAYSMASLPNHSQNPMSPPLPHHPSPTDPRRMSTPAIPTVDGSSGNADGIKTEPGHPSQNGQFPPLWQDMGPFTTSLPPETQQMLAYAPQLDHNDPSYAMLMQGSDQFTSSPFYPWPDMQHGGGGVKGMPVHPSAWQGMSATLAPAVLDQNAMTSGVPQQAKTEHGMPANHVSTSTSPETTLPPSTGIDFNFSQDSKPLNFDMSRENSFQGFSKSGQATPAGEGFWDNFVIDGSWDDDHNITGGGGANSDHSVDVPAI
ncbi:hypothetical protein PV10_00657 [Exophiala mesophila]|uniref:Uncharacterized protein n=1 Tax=Exophiala mesophila TaxID=212818 RepID=A0A0D1X4W4_EXOME|nr:uncharacterized protein PV10_00657 [Exophiala mesophila]KIV96840.1 hypothetical protein PV10_00657 [Exophiala mesophila]